MGGAPDIITIRPGVQFTPPAAASFRRFEARLGRQADVNSTYREYGKQLRMHYASLAYQNGTGPYPGHSYAAHPDYSKHTLGIGWDTDDWKTPGFLALAAEYGWIQILPNDPTERHHLEYQWWNDQHRNDPEPEDDTMSAAEVADIKNYIDQASRDAAGLPGAGAWLIRYAKSRETGTVFALYQNAQGGKYRVPVKTDDEKAVIGSDVTVWRSIDLQAWGREVAADGVVFHPGEPAGYGRSTRSGNVFALYRNNRGGQARRLVPADSITDEVTDMTSSALWAYAPINTVG